tara:strand:+ start:120 stop:428 length:309 start_codon:yes stop_codon:yes gene_type:complete
MPNSDYLIKATIKKISEKLNKTFSSKIDEAAAVAQEVPELLKKEIEALKGEIIEEAKRMETEGEEDQVNRETISDDESFIRASKKISFITQKVNEINTILDN